MSTIKLTEADVQNCTWTVVEVTPTYRRSVGKGTHPISGLPIEVGRTEFLAEDDLLAINAERRNMNDGRRWSSGAGSEKGGNVPMIHVASIPMNKYIADFAQKAREGDKDHAKWLLSSDAYKPFRTRNGRL